MSLKVQLKHSAVKDKAPVAADLSAGELALNINDQSPAAYIKDSAGNIVKIAGAGAVGDDWTRTGTELSPATAGDSVFTTGAVKVGGTTAAPKTELKADGSATFAGDVKIGSIQWNKPDGNGVYTKLNSSGYSEFQINNNAATPSACLTIRSTAYTGSLFPGNVAANIFNDGSANFAGKRINLNADGSAKFAGDIKLGGTLPASPNITLSAAGNINALGAVSRVYADNAAAKAGGLLDGDIYRKADGTLMIVFT